jgi:hypothetical protein
MVRYWHMVYQCYYHFEQVESKIYMDYSKIYMDYSKIYMDYSKIYMDYNTNTGI